MSRIATPQIVSGKVYRHFAVVTVIATACLAMFANGEDTQALERQLAAAEAKGKQAVVETAQAGRPKGANNALRIAVNAASASSWGSDEAPVDGGSGWDTVIQPQKRQARRFQPLKPPPGAPTRRFGDGSTDVGEGVLVAVGPDASDRAYGPQAVSAADRQAMIAASYERSGSTGE